MEELRLTVTSTPTLEFPQNQNNKFKVRLPDPLVLPDGPWALSLWSLSVPDGAVDKSLGPDGDLFCAAQGKIMQLGVIRHGKYRASLNTQEIQVAIRMSELYATHPSTGVDFWKRAIQKLEERRMDQLAYWRARNNRHIQQPEVWFPTFRWEGEDLILEPSRQVFYQPLARKARFILTLKTARLFGFMKQDPTTKAWSIGPNLIPSYPSFEYTGHDISSSVHPRIKGTTQRALITYDVDTTDPYVDWFRLFPWDPGLENLPSVELSGALEWRFIHLNRSYQQFSKVLSGTKDTVMVYTDVVQPNTVNGVKVPLLRSVQLDQRGQGRRIVEPLHREWIPLMGNTMEVLELQLATPSGPLIQLPPGPTTVTLGLTPIKA